MHIQRKNILLTLHEPTASSSYRIGKMNYKISNSKIITNKTI